MSIKTGKVVAYQPNGEAEIKGMKYNRFLVTFADGQQWKFLAKGEFKKQIGEVVAVNQYQQDRYYTQENVEANQALVSIKHEGKSFAMIRGGQSRVGEIAKDS